MNGSDALWAALSQGMPTSFTGMVAAAGGSTRAVAGALGVSMRTVQRRMVGEARAAGRPTKATQERGQSARGQAIGSKAMRAAHAAAQKGKPVHASAKGAFGWGGGGGAAGGGYDYESEGDVRTLDDFDDDYADAMWEAFAEGNEDGAWDAFEDGLFDAYGMGDDVYTGIEFVGGEVDTFDIDFG